MKVDIYQAVEAFYWNTYLPKDTKSPDDREREVLDFDQGIKYINKHHFLPVFEFKGTMNCRLMCIGNMPAW